MDRTDIDRLLKGLDGWHQAGQTIKKTFKFDDFKSALKFVDQVGDLAEAVNHHPLIELSWGRVGLSLTSHDSGGLSRRDFDLAQKIDQLN
ncbi:MAG TPA: 4a-hydroxytetrahydrobiopterin dehydratase [Candidatus Saccharimonadales bacterium]